MNIQNKTKAFMRAQASVETLLIIGIAILFIIPLVLIFYSSASLKLQNLDQLQAKAMIQQISDAAGQVWYEGEGAKRTVIVNYPNGLGQIIFSGQNIDEFSQDIKTKGREITLRLDDSGGTVVDVVGLSPAPIKDGGIDEQRLDYIMQSTGHFNSGLVVLVVKNQGNYVNITRFVSGVN